MLATLKRWTRPMVEDIENWMARGDPLAIYDVAIRQRRRKLPELEAAVASIARLCDKVRAEAKAEAEAEADLMEHVAQLETNLTKAEQGLSAYLAEIEHLVTERAALADRIARRNGS
ncbi:MAG: chromosome segregation ATPase [Myxococcota bacterium]|jgi:chromosome segregation ATPase